MSAAPTPTAAAWQPASPVHPRPDPEHEARTAEAIARALREIPFYRKRGAPADAAGATALGRRLGGLPLLRKQDIRATLPKQWVPDGRDTRAELESGALLLVETSVSTGARLRVLWTADDQARMLDELGRHGTVALESDPLYLAVLAGFAASRGRRVDVHGFVQLTYAFTTGAYLRAIRAAFAGPVLQLYGASEIGVLFMEGEDGRLHHCPFTTHVELLRARVPTPGAEDVALVVATSLDRVAMPLVRFVLGDLVQVDRGAPRRWTSVPALRSVEGRVDDAVVRPDGALVTPGAMDRALAACAELRLWQVNQRAPDRVEVDVVADGDADRVAAEVGACLAPLFEGLAATVRAVTAIAIEPSGKFRVSKRHFPLDLDRCFEREESAPS